MEISKLTLKERSKTWVLGMERRPWDLHGSAVKRQARTAASHSKGYVTALLLLWIQAMVPSSHAVCAGWLQLCVRVCMCVRVCVCVNAPHDSIFVCICNEICFQAKTF